MKSYVSGEKHFVFGKEYTLEVKIDRKNSVSLCDDKLILSIKDEDQDKRTNSHKRTSEKFFMI